MLDETGMDSGLGDVLLGASKLESLSLKGSKVDGALISAPLTSSTSMLMYPLRLQVLCMFKVIERCPALTKLDLTSVRGIPLRDRRSFFDVRPAICIASLSCAHPSSLLTVLGGGKGEKGQGGHRRS